VLAKEGLPSVLLGFEEVLTCFWYRRWSLWIDDKVSPAIQAQREALKRAQLEVS